LKPANSNYKRLPYSLTAQHKMSTLLHNGAAAVEKSPAPENKVPV